MNISSRRWMERLDWDKNGYSGQYSGFDTVTVDNQMIPDVSDEYRKKKASALLNTIGIPLPSNFQWGNKWTIELPGAEVTICVYKSASKLPRQKECYHLI